jgi:hypothetical protein
MPAWLRYTLLRLLFIVVPLVLLLVLFGTQYWLWWAVASVIIGFALSYIFLRGPRDQMATELAARAQRRHETTSDDAAEEAEIDAALRRDDSEA